MNRSNVAQIVLCILVGAPAVQGDEIPDSILKFFPGQWRVEGPGDTVGTVEWTPVAGGKAAAGPGESSDGGANYGLAGWQGRDKKWVHLLFNADGSYAYLEIHRMENKTYYGTQRVVDAGGKVIEAQVVNRITGPDSFEVIADDGQQKIVTRWTRLNRAAAVSQQPAAKFRPVAANNVVGNWTLEGVVGGEDVKGSMQVRPAPDGMSLIYNYLFGPSQEKMLRGTILGGRDPAKGQFFEYVFESDGSHYVNCYPGEDSPDVGVTYGQRSGTIAGKLDSGTITVDRKSRDYFVYTVTSQTGKDVKFHFRRVAGDPRGDSTAK